MRYKPTQEEYERQLAKEAEQKKRIFSKKKEIGIALLTLLIGLFLFIFVI